MICNPIVLVHYLIFLVELNYFNIGNDEEENDAFNCTQY